jgi:hypothetical protein
LSFPHVVLQNTHTLLIRGHCVPELWIVTLLFTHVVSTEGLRSAILRMV